MRYPLKLLQRVGTGTYECFLYDDSWLGTDSTRVIDAHGNQIELFPGVCHTLARLAPLVKPAFQLAWVDDVRRMNREVLGDEPDIAAHLFGTERVSLARPAKCSPTTSATTASTAMRGCARDATSITYSRGRASGSTG